MDKLGLRDRFKDKTQKSDVVNELCELPNKEAAEILGINPKYWSRVKTLNKRNIWQRYGIRR